MLVEWSRTLAYLMLLGRVEAKREVTGIRAWQSHLREIQNLSLFAEAKELQAFVYRHLM